MLLARCPSLPCQHPVHSEVRATSVGRRVRCKAALGPEARGVFDAFDHGSNVTVFDARDAIETCAGLEGKEATACFAYFGCDRHRVSQWFDVVAGLEQSLAIPDEEELDVDEYSSDRRFPEPFDSIFDMWAETAEQLQRAHTAQAAMVDWPQRARSTAQNS